jgi:Uma2 family endonuclease
MTVSLEYLVHDQPERWLLEEEDVPETPLHDAIIALLKLVLEHGAARRGADALIARNLGCRWLPEDARVGADPDVAWIEPAPPEPERISTLRVWEPGHYPPRLAVEVVSEATADKDYFDAPARFARLGVNELWVFDPLLLGPTGTGGPFALQVWRRSGREPARMERIHAGPAPAFSPELEAWAVTTEDGARLRVADDDAGERLWPTLAEREAARAEEKAARAEEEAARAEALAAEVARLKKQLGEG